MEDVKIKAFLDLGSGSGSGSGYGDGDGDGYGAWYGDGSGYGYGSGSGDESGYGSGYIARLNGMDVYLVDGAPTIFRAVHGNAAKGWLLGADLTLHPCYVVKGQGKFAHGETLREAAEALKQKLFEDMSEEERIEAFIEEHPDMDKAYPNRDLFDWHNRLTGSCLMGRNKFVKERGLSLEGETTVRGFIELTLNAYGGDTIRKLEEAYEG